MRNLLTCLALVGCADNAIETPESITVEVEASDEHGSLVGTVWGERAAVDFEVVVGVETPIETRDVDVPAREIDVRFVDENGAPFLMQIGGHSPMDPQWADDLNELTPVGDRKDLLALVPAAAAEALRMGLAQDVVDALDNMAVAAVTVDELAPEPLAEDGALPPPSTSYTQTMYRRSKAAWNLSATTVGEHSAVYVNVYSSSGSLTSTYYTCNHGTCANSSSMSTYASGSFTTSGIVANYLCTTSWGLTSGQHTCNDDTLMQYRVLYFNSTSPSSSTCSDSSLRRYAP